MNDSAYKAASEQLKREIAEMVSVFSMSIQKKIFVFQKTTKTNLGIPSVNELFSNITEEVSKTSDNTSVTLAPENSDVTAFADYPQFLLHFGAICFIVFAVVGIFGNLTSILALSLNPKTRNATTAFIVNLCAADFLFCSFSMPLSAIIFLEKGWNHGDALCALFPLVRYANGAVSLFSVIAITVNRYILIGHPKIYGLVYSKRNVALMIALMWIFSLIFLLPPYLEVWGKLGYDPRVGTCTILEKNGKSPKTCYFIAAFVLPSVVFVVCYLKIYFVVRKGSRKTRRLEDKLFASTISHRKVLENKSWGSTTTLRSGYVQHRNKKELKVLQVMLVVFLLFILCYFPAFFVKIFQKELDFPILNVVGYLGVYLSNIINPLIYVCMSDVYRRAYKELFCRWRTNGVSPHSSSRRPGIV